MKDLISRQAVLDLIEHYNSDGLGTVFIDYRYGLKFSEKIKALPSIEPQPKTGHWIEDEYEMKVWCSACGEENDKCSKYCPDCGAKMVGSEESEV